MSVSSDLPATAKVDLAHAPAFELGGVRVVPALRQLVRPADGTDEVVEPRVMQVLVALARADGGIVTRDELIEACWDGRVVGEDALNRAISRVRRLAAGIGRGSFKLETITKVGYRLVVLGDALPREEPVSAAPLPPQADQASANRRGWLAGVIALAGAGVAGWVLLDRRRAPEPTGPSPAVGALVDQATQALNQGTREGQNQAFGLYRRAMALQPDYADGWGLLGFAYASVAPYRSSAEGETLRMRAIEAARRALALDPGNARAEAVFALVVPVLGGWLARERRLRGSLTSRPTDRALLLELANTMVAVGRWDDALGLYDQVGLQPANPTPGQYFPRIRATWGANRLEEADKLIAEAVALFPTHFAIWFMRFYVLMYSGRAGEAIALGENKLQRPTGIATAEFQAILRVARAMESREAAAIDAVIDEQLGRARQGAGYAENAMQFASALGRVDDALAIADAYYFDRGFTVPEVRFTPEQGSYTPRRERLTLHLFTPSTAAMRADRRFEKLVDKIGLTQYWTLSGSKPDWSSTETAGGALGGR